MVRAEKVPPDKFKYDCGCVWSYIPEERFRDPRPGIEGVWGMTTICRVHSWDGD